MHRLANWIFAVNGFIILSELLLCQQTYNAYQQPRWALIPIEISKWVFCVYGACKALQCLSCVLGVIGMAYSIVPAVIVWWTMTVVLLCMDLLFGIPFVQSMSEAHSSLQRNLPSMATSKFLNCEIWGELNDEYACCPPLSVGQFCNHTIFTSFEQMACSETMFGSHCGIPLRKWMHGYTDTLAFIIFFILVPLKLVVLITLRKDCQQVFAKIVELMGDDGIPYDETDEEDVRLSIESSYSPFIKRHIIEEIESNQPQRMYAA